MVRIDKMLSNLKYGSRKEIDKAIREKRVKINGEVCKSAKVKVDPKKDEVIFDGEVVYYEESILLMLNKPKGYVSANHDDLHPTVFDFVYDPYHRFDLNIAGRLDIDTEGLLLLTNDGQILHEIIHPSKNVYKEYYVTVDQPFDPSLLLEEMVIMDGNNAPYTPMKPEVEVVDDLHFYLRIKEGKFHQVKRMVAHHGREVIALKRTKIGALSLGDLPLGEMVEVNIEQIKG